ncbi:alpha/beta hydrolase [Rhodococcoides trifolii]|uniref:Alpha/beta hydrolase n=1 Tax=Rhodococcoides trifolii TaxID=908250 RepID=A0A917CW63_9NOCA|nr:alpha/beta hydrolase [Rhodococcus trifolii]GGG00367.1 alpha/beta hydrolase [Rhodococcus trifolii]
MSEAVPSWFVDATSTPADERDLLVDGCSIRVRSWGDPARPGIVLVHGGAANSRWWDHIAPVLARAYRVVAFDLSGHGDSGHREMYDLRDWARETLAVTATANFPAPPTVIGHSMGGWVSLVAGRLDDAFSGIAVIDTPLTERTPEQRAAADKRAFGPVRTYPTRTELVSRFRPVPDQPNSLPFITEYVAERSVVETPDGWRWKFDPRVFVGARPDVAAIGELSCRTMMFGAENGLVGPNADRQMYHLLGKNASVVVIPRAGHHIMLDEPLALTASLLTLLALWGV